MNDSAVTKHELFHSFHILVRNRYHKDFGMRIVFGGLLHIFEMLEPLAHLNFS